MNTRLEIRLAAILLSGCLTASFSHAQSDRTDPTAAPTAMADALRAQLAEFRAISIQALAVGADDEGVAILNTGGLRTTSPNAAQSTLSENAIVRAGSALVMENSGISLRLTIKSVTSKGVEIEAPSLTEKLFIPGSFKAIPPDGKLTGKFLRYLECKELPIETLLRLIADQTGANLSASAKASKELISIFLRNVSADQAVEEICRTRGLWFRKDDATDITRVTTMSEYEENLSSFREETVESFTLLYPNVLEVASVIYGLYPERVMLSLGEEQILQDESRDISRRFERLNSISSSSGSGLLNNQAGGSSGYGNSGGSGGGYGGSGYGNSGYSGGGYGSSGYSGGYGSGGLSVFGSRNSSTTVIDQRTRQSFSKLTPTDAKELDKIMRQGGTNATSDTAEAYREKSANIFVTVSRRNNLLVVRTGDPEVMKEIRNLVRRLDVPTPMVLLEVKVLQLSINNDLTASFQYEFTKNYSVNSKTVKTTAGFPGFNPLDTAADSDALSFQVLSDHLNVRIQMLEKDGHVKTLATPTLLTANNEVSRLFIGEERPMVKSITSQTVVNDNNTVTTPQTETELQLVGTMLVITPNINADRTVTLRLLQENSKILKNDATIPITTSAGEVQNVTIDVVSSRSVTGTFVAKDEMIVAVGGMIEESEENQQSKIPVLGSIPYLGWFFRSTEKVKTRSELILLIKPHVISTPSEGEAISQRVTKELSAHPAADGRPSLYIYKNDPNAKTNDVEHAGKDK